MSYEENVRAILECNFAGFKDEIIDRAVKMIMELEPKQIVIPKDIELPHMCQPILRFGMSHQSHQRKLLVKI